ncbi:MAG: adenylyl-sulfate kinase [Candidatus Sumerlaeota bacterium]|nr:adenylyl-sulfate kinase [Candidatus Sumerlaeota bacterium]
MTTHAHKSENIIWQEGHIKRISRELRNNHRGAIIWLTGLSGSGKTTIAVALEHVLFRNGKQCFRLDGDNVRFGLCADLGFSPEDRAENIRRIGEVSKLLVDAGLIVITSFISPYRADRDSIRQSVAHPGDFIEVYLQCPMEVCEQRDVKGLYAKARAGLIKEFTGVSAPYEIPGYAEIALDTAHETVEQCVNKIMQFLQEKDYFDIDEK